MEGIRSTCTTLFGKLERNIPLLKQRRLDDNIKMDLKE
jgi:hypothetical protein